MKVPKKFLHPASLGLLLMLSAAPPAWSIEPRLYLAWHAPYGSPRATDALSIRCGDGGRDTLFLTYETGVDTTQFCGLEGVLLFRAPASDSLSAYWRNLEIDLQTQFFGDSIPDCTRPWIGSNSMSFGLYDFTQMSGRLQLSHVRPPIHAVAVRDSVHYLFARVLIPHPPAGFPRCDQPICIEWVQGQLLMDPTARTSVMAGRRGRTFVSMNSRGGEVCAPFKPEFPTKKPKAWQPSREGSAGK